MLLLMVVFHVDTLHCFASNKRAELCWLLLLLFLVCSFCPPPHTTTSALLLVDTHVCLDVLLFGLPFLF